MEDNTEPRQRASRATSPHRMRAESPLLASAPELSIIQDNGVTHVMLCSDSQTSSEGPVTDPSSPEFIPKREILYPTADSLHERNNFLISELLTRFQNIVKLAPVPDGEVTKAAAAAQAFQMKVETTALIKAAEDLLKLSRELKELWLFGPLRGLGEGESNSKMDQDAGAIEHMVDDILKKVGEMGV